MPYKHTQISWVVLPTCLGAVVLFYLLPSTPAARLIAQPGICFILLFAAGMMGTLTVEVDATLVRIKFGVGVIHKSFRLDEIAACQPVRNKWRYGWGIRRLPDGWLYNVSGLGAVELVMKSGQKFRIGTDEPRRLADVIQARLNKSA